MLHLEEEAQEGAEVVGDSASPGSLARLVRDACVAKNVLQGRLPALRLAPPEEVVFEAPDVPCGPEAGTTVALCVHNRNRGRQLRHALPLNLAHLWPSRRWVKIVFVDFNSTDVSLDWVLEHCACAIECSFLRVFSAVLPKEEEYHTAIAKNATHVKAIASLSLRPSDIIVNVDCDNLLGPGFAWHVAGMLAKKRAVLQYYGGRAADGTYGRIACGVRDLVKVNGDLICRLQSECDGGYGNYGVAAPGGWPLCQAIPNAKSELVGPTTNWKAMDKRNRLIFQKRRLRHIVRNPAGFGLVTWKEFEQKTRTAQVKTTVRCRACLRRLCCRRNR